MVETRISWRWKGAPTFEFLRTALKPHGIVVEEDPDYEGSDYFGYVLRSERPAEENS